MRGRMQHGFLPFLAMLLTILMIVSSTAYITWAANHREAPITALDHKADIADWFAFVSYDDSTKVTMILDVDPLLEPANGPNYFPFDPEILYEMKIDNDRDGKEDIIFQFRFKTEIRLPGVFTGFVGVDNGINTPDNSPPPLSPGTPLIPPAITALDGAGSQGLSVRQTYTVTMIKKHRSTVLSAGRTLLAVPSNVGPRTMPDYENLARQGIYDLGDGVRVFAGTVDDPFYIDLGAAFDTLNFRPSASGVGVPGVLSDTQDADDTKNFAPDDVAGFNVNAIVLEVPITMLTSDGRWHAPDDPKAVIGTYGTTSRPRIKILPTRPGKEPLLSRHCVQIQRMSNALINELLIGTGDKDKFSMSEPYDDAQFANYVLDPLLARVINAASGGAVPIPPPPRLDLAPLVLDAPPICPACTTPASQGPIADLLRLNTGVPPTPQANRKRLGVLAGDLAGYPNGRRVSDDVLDISARAVVGALAGPPFNGFPNNRIGDGVSTNEVDGQRLSLQDVASEILFPPGAGGLPTLKLGLLYRAPLAPLQAATGHQLSYRDSNFPGRAGWQEIIAVAGPGVTVVQSTVPATDRSRVLTDYPTNLLNSPPQVREAQVVFTLVPAQEATAVDTPTPSALAANRQGTPRSAFTDLVTTPRLSLGIVCLALAVAAGLGACHALEPGHGKTVVAAYLVGTQGTARHALALGLIVTATHTAGVYLLGAVTLYASHAVVPERLYPWLGVLSGLIVASLGGWLFVRRYTEHVQAHTHTHGHTPGHGAVSAQPHTHAYVPAHTHRHLHHDELAHLHPPAADKAHGHHAREAGQTVSCRALLTLGVTGGMIPCPAALVVLLSAVAWRRVGFGMLLIVAFSIGLAAVLIAIGLLMVYAQRFMACFQGEGRLLSRWLPLTSATLITLSGVALVVQALVTTGVLQIRLL